MNLVWRRPHDISLGKPNNYHSNFYMRKASTKPLQAVGVAAANRIVVQLTKHGMLLEATRFASAFDVPLTSLLMHTPSRNDLVRHLYGKDGARQLPVLFAAVFGTTSSKILYLVSRDASSQKKSSALWVQRVLENCQRNSHSRQMDFSIDAGDIARLWIKQNGLCCWFQVPMETIGGVHAPRSISVDRIDNSLGYVNSNIVLACRAANMGRGRIPPETFARFCAVMRRSWALQHNMQETERTLNRNEPVNNSDRLRYANELLRRQLKSMRKRLDDFEYAQESLESPEVRERYDEYVKQQETELAK